MKIQPIQTITQPTRVKYTHVGFQGLLPTKGGYHSVYREFNPRTSNCDTDVRYQFYDQNLNPVGESSLLLPQAEDPRIFEFQNIPYCAAIIYRPTPGDLSPNREEWLQVIVNLLTGDSKILAHDLNFAGKNWVPVVGGKHLQAIRSLDPLCIVDIDLRTRTASTIEPEPASRHIGEYRGGAAATVTANVITGYGHRTVTSPMLRHIPYRYEINLATMQASFTDLQPEGFGLDLVIDPTSQIGADLIVCTCARQSWWIDQPITTQLCQITHQTFGLE